MDLVNSVEQLGLSPSAAAAAATPRGVSAGRRSPRSPSDDGALRPRKRRRPSPGGAEERPAGDALPQLLPLDLTVRRAPPTPWAASTRSPGSSALVIDLDCQDGDHPARPESQPRAQLRAHAQRGSSWSRARPAEEDGGEGEDTLSPSSQGGEVTPWELGPWVVRAPRTPSLPPPPSPPCPAASPRTPPPPLRLLPVAAQQTLCAPGSVLRSAVADYVVLGTLGRGAYGQVLHCREAATARSRAVKVLRMEGAWGVAARNEARALHRISVNDPDRHNLVRFFEAFQHDDRLFVVMEALDMNLEVFLSQNGQCLRMDGIASILRQLFVALRKLQDLDIIHADVKPSNVVLANRTAQRWRVKLVDLSNALSTRRALHAANAQTLWYRAPEVALGQAFCAAADVWSLGCVAAELATAVPLYPAHCNATLLHAVTRTHGPLPDALLARPGRTDRYYTRDAHGRWALMELSTAHECKGFTSMDDVCVQYFEKQNEEDRQLLAKQTVLFRDLLEKMLEIYQENRVCPAEALSHPLLKGEHLF